MKSNILINILALILCFICATKYAYAGNSSLTIFYLALCGINLTFIKINGKKKDR